MHRAAVPARARRGLLRPLPAMDLPFLILVLTLVGFGLVMLYSASSAVALYRRGDAWAYVRPQLLYAAMGIGAMWAASRVDYHIYHKLAWPLLALSLVLLVVVLFMPEYNGCKRWLVLPGLGTLQPSEIAKFAVVLVFAHIISLNHSRMESFAVGVMPFALVLGAVAVLYGKGFILDTLCGKTYAISPRSFYQINHAQTEVLYGLAVEAAKLTGKEVVLDAYCGIGTIGLTAADHAKQVVGVELNRDAVQDAIGNARHNGVKNARFFAADATRWIREAAAAGEKADVIFMDPPREGSTPEFLASVARMAPKRVVYVSCNPVTLARDLATLTKLGYKAEGFTPVDMFPHTEHIETVCALSKLEIHRKKPSGKR